MRYVRNEGFNKQMYVCIENFFQILDSREEVTYSFIKFTRRVIIHNFIVFVCI